jgi:hypothetical protein
MMNKVISGIMGGIHGSKVSDIHEYPSDCMSMIMGLVFYVQAAHMYTL